MTVQVRTCNIDEVTTITSPLLQPSPPLPLAPPADAQAQDRAFRLGQVRDVGVYRLVAAGSLEEVVYGRQVYKQQAAALTLTGQPEKRQFEGVQVR
jgi:hypothetical protein